jgi:hypothetical protein
MARSNSSGNEYSLLNIFEGKLERDWKRKTACGAGYIDVRKLTRWMEMREPDQQTPNVGRLLHELNRYERIDATSQTILDRESGDRCLLVFSILLGLGKGNLIDMFASTRITDSALDHLYPKHPTYAELLAELRRRGVAEAEKIIEDFETAKWSYCPAMIKLYKSAGNQGGKVLPFVRKEPITEKGVGTSLS